MRFLTFSMVIALFLSLPACERSQTTRAASDAQAVSDQNRRAYERRVEARLAEFEYRFDGLEARLKGLDEADQEHLRVDIQELRERKDALKQKLNDLRKVSDQSWLDVRAALDRELDKLEVAYNVVSANNHGQSHPPLN